MELQEIVTKIAELCCGLPSQTEWLFLTSEVSVIAGSYYGGIYITDHPDIQTDFIKFCASRSISAEEEDRKTILESQENYWTEEVKPTDLSSDINDGIDLPEKVYSNFQGTEFRSEEIDSNFQGNEFRPEEIDVKPDISSENRHDIFPMESNSSKLVCNDLYQNKPKSSKKKRKAKTEKKKKGKKKCKSGESTIPKINILLSDSSDDTKRQEKLEENLCPPSRQTLMRWSRGGKQATLAQQLAAQNRQYNSRMKEPKVDKDGNRYYECEICGIHYISYKETIAHYRKDHMLSRSFPCKECDKVLHTRNVWLYHTENKHSNHSERNLFHCEKCLSSFFYSSRLKVHQKNCKGSGIEVITCNLCGDMFVHDVLLQNHIKLTHSGIDAKIKCRHCDLWFKSEEEMTKHAEDHQSSSYQCRYCKECFSSNDELIQHGNCLNKIKSLPLKCELCGKNFKKFKFYRSHMLLHVKTNTKAKFECEICNKECISEKGYRRHKLSHLPNAEKPFHCEECGQGFVVQTDLKFHIKTFHDRKSDFMCEICGRAYNYSRSLTAHIRRVHTGEKPFKCDVCQEAFFTNRAMEYHKKNTHLVTENICEVCGKKCPSSEALRIHQYHHKKISNRKEVQCDQCNKILPSRDNYLKHFARNHLSSSDINSFPMKVVKCEECGKIFTNNAKLKEHMRIHTGEKPHKCSHCGKGFADWSNMRVHERSHTDTERHGCVCGKSFAQARGLRIHQGKCAVHIQGESIKDVDISTRNVNQESLNSNVRNNEEVSSMAVLSEELPQALSYIKHVT